MDNRTDYKRAYNERTYARLAITIPKARKRDVEAHAAIKNESINALVNRLIRTDMGLSDSEWKRIAEETDQQRPAHDE